MNEGRRMATSTYGTLIVIKRNGQDGSRFPVKTTTCMIGRNADSDIRIQLPAVSDQHCRIDVVNDGQVVLVNLSKANYTLLNDVPITTSAIIAHQNVFTVGDRSFRWEFMENSPHYSAVTSKPANISESPLSRNSMPSVNANKASGDEDSLKAESAVTPQNHGRSWKSAKKRPSALEAPDIRSHLSANGHLSARKVSFGPSLSPEQFDHSLPSATPIKKGARPLIRRSSLPDYYGNPVLTSSSSGSKGSNFASKERSNSKSPKRSPKAASPNVNMEMSVKGGLAKSANVAIVKTPKKKIAKLTAKSLSTKIAARCTKMAPKSKSAESKKDKSIRMHSDVDNAVKVVAPFSLDSKKSEALRTIHAGKLKNKPKSPVGRRSSSSKKILKVQTPFKSADTKVSKGSKRNSLRSTSSSSVSSWQDEISDGSPLHPNELFVSPLNSSGNSIKTPSSAVKRYLMETKPKRRSARTSDSLNVSGIDRLLETPPASHKHLALKKPKTKVGKSPVTGDTHIKHLFKRSPKLSDSNVKGLKRLMGKSPKANYSDVQGLKRLMKKSPKADYSNVQGLKRLMKKCPKADYSDVRGVKSLFGRPLKSEYSDVFGLKRLMRSPAKSPKSGLTDVYGLKRLMKTPHKSPKADYDNVEGLEELFKEQSSMERIKRRSSTSPEMGVIKKRKISDATTPIRNVRVAKTTAETVTSSTEKPQKVSGTSPALQVTVTPARRGRPPKMAATGTSAVRSLVKSPSPSPVVRTLRSSVRKPRSTPLKASPEKATPRGRKMKTSAVREILETSPAVVDDGQSPKKLRTSISKKESVEAASSPVSTRKSKKKAAETPKAAKKPARRKAEKTTVDESSMNEVIVLATPLRNTRAKAKKGVEVPSEKSPKGMVTRRTHQKVAKKSPGSKPEPSISALRRGRSKKTD